MQIKKEDKTFNFEVFKAKATEVMRSGKDLVGKEGLFTPSYERFFRGSFDLQIVKKPSDSFECLTL